MRLIRVDSDRMVFAAVLDRGVPTIPKRMKEAADKLAEKIGVPIKDCGGDHSEVWFFFDHDITEEQAEKIEADYEGAS